MTTQTIAPVLKTTAPRRLGPGAWLAMLFLVLVAVAAVFPGLLVDGKPGDADVLSALQGPGGDHLLGTDANGRDLLVRIVYGARPSMLAGLGATALAVSVGTLLGLLAGLGGRIADEIVMRLADVVLSLPSLLLALLILVVTGPGTANSIYAIAIYTTPGFARLVRIQSLVIRRSPYVEAAVSLGLHRTRIILRHIVPNVFAPLLVLATIEVGTALVAAASLSFLGFGPKPPTPEWGAMLAGGSEYFQVAWWVSVFPGLAITLTVLALTVSGRALQRWAEGRTS